MYSIMLLIANLSIALFTDQPLFFILFLLFFLIQWLMSSHFLKNMTLPILYLLIQYSVSTLSWYVTFDLPNLLTEKSNLLFFSHINIFILLFVQSIFVFCLSRVIRALFEKYSVWDKISLTKTPLKSVGPFAFILLMVLTILHVSISNSKNQQLIIWIIFIILSITTLFFTIIFLVAKFKNLYLENISLRKQMEAEQNLYEFSREFQHDLKAVLISLEGFIREHRSTEALNYLQSIEHENNQNTKYQFTNQISYIMNFPVQAFLHQFFSECTKKNINFTLIVTADLKSIGIDTLSYVRCISIILNNAAEEISGDLQKKISIHIYRQQDENILQVKNPVPADFSMKNIFKKGYSTKVSHKGVGLSTLKKLVDRYPNATLTFHTSNSDLIVELKIRDNKKTN